MITTLRGLDLLDAAIDHIEKHPGTWVQESYRCETGMCLAGWAAELAGGTWVGEAGTLHGQCLIAEPGDPADAISRGHTSADARAAMLLGARFLIDGRDLFGARNTLAEIKAMRDDLRAGAA